MFFSRLCIFLFLLSIRTNVEHWKPKLNHSYKVVKLSQEMMENFVDNPQHDLGEEGNDVEEALVIVDQSTNSNPYTNSSDEESKRTSIMYPLRTKGGADERLQNEDFPRNQFKLSRNIPLVRSAMPNDSSSLVKLASSVALPNLDPAKLNDTGFLVSGFTEKQYSSFIQSAEHFLVLHVGEELVAFLLAYGSEQIVDPVKEELNMYIKTEMCDGGKFVLIKQICVSPKLKHRRHGYGKMLYKELYARILHYYDHESTPRPIFTAIVKEPANPVSIRFHEKVGFENVKEYTPSIDMKPRFIFKNAAIEKALDTLTDDDTRTESCPKYDSRAAQDPHCVGIGLTMYAIEAPDTDGKFLSHVRVMMKWRQPGIEILYPRKDDGNARTEIKFQDHAYDRNIVRFPRYDLNKDDVNLERSYTYIDKTDPQDVITWQQVLRGTFRSELKNLHSFPADIQHLNLTFRMWDNDPDDRCRYFRQLDYADNTPWPLCVKRRIKSLAFTFLAPEVDIDVFEVSQTSRYIVRVPVLRNASYYLRTVAFPMLLITSLSFASVDIEEFGDKVGYNASLLLTTVAYLFITKDVTPDTSDVTMLDVITYSALLLCWALIMVHFLGTKYADFDVKTTSLGLCCVTTVLQCIVISYCYFRYKNVTRRGDKLGQYSWSG